MSVESVEELDDKVILTHPDNPGTSVTVLKHGATVISWILDTKEQLWLSSAAKLDGSKPVRGGIPLVFPQFGKKTEGNTKELPQHGFARSTEWEFLGQVKENPPTVQFGLGPELVDADVLAKWEGGEYDFSLILTVELAKESLKTEIEVLNTGKVAFEFNWLFHTYLRVDDIEDVLVSNLPGTLCYDQLLKQSYEEKQPVVHFHEEVDRIYQKINDDTIIQVVELGHPVHTLKRDGLPDVVVWNPWTAKSGGMADFEPKKGYKNMVCIEPGYVSEFKRLEAGENWKGAQLLTKDALNFQAI
jgi:glucose-6-phosphate 1-epimerase